MEFRIFLQIKYQNYFSLPPLAEQKQIAVKIDALMALCDGLEKGIDEAESKRAPMLETVFAGVKRLLLN